MEAERNFDPKVVSAFGQEWQHFDQAGLDSKEVDEIFGLYFKIFPWDRIRPNESVGADIGCGSGRWARAVAPKVKKLFLIDASVDALDTARKNLSKAPNVNFVHASVDGMPIENNTLDFAYSLGVLHHIPDTEAGIKSVAQKLKSGAPFLLYLYYAFDNRPFLFRYLWKLSEIFRYSISRLPFRLRVLTTEVIAVLVYWPLSRVAAALDRLKILPTWWPLSFYRNRSFYVMRTDALDRFGTRLEKRFTKNQIEQMLIRSGFHEIQFSSDAPFWCAVGFKN